MGLSLLISAVQTYDRKVIPLKLSPIIDMVLEEDEEAEERLSSDWTAGALLSNTYNLSQSSSKTVPNAEITCVNECEPGHMLQGSCSRMRRSTDVQTREDLPKTVKVVFCPLFSDAQEGLR